MKVIKAIIREATWYHYGMNIMSPGYWISLLGIIGLMCLS